MLLFRGSCSYILNMSSIPSPANDLYDQANASLAMGDLERAVQLYAEATQADASCFDAWQALGMTYVKLNRPKEAIEALLKATSLKPNDAMAYTSLSIAYARNNEITKAEEAAARARVVSWGGKAEML